MKLIWWTKADGPVPYSELSDVILNSAIKGLIRSAYIHALRIQSLSILLGEAVTEIDFASVTQDIRYIGLRDEAMRRKSNLGRRWLQDDLMLYFYSLREKKDKFLQIINNEEIPTL